MIPSNPIAPNMQPIIIQMAPQAPTSIIQPATVIQPLRTVGLVNPPQNKLPLPKLNKSMMHLPTTTTASGLVNVYSTPMMSSQPWRLPKEKKKRNRAKKVHKESNSASAGSVVEGITTTNDKEQSEFVRISTISESVPKEILASQDHETEVVDLTNATANSSNHDTNKKDPKVSEAKTNKKAKNKETNQVTGSKIAKTKSSYSIAALCQMSVNIGADPATGVPDPNAASGVSSPGVISLNSTESPRATPTPQSPKPPTLQPTPMQQPQPTTKLQQPNKPISKAGERSKKVIEELKPVGDKVSEMQQGPTSPTKSYLTQFPVVKDQQQPQQNKKPADQQIKQKSTEKVSTSSGKLKEVSTTSTLHHSSTPKVAPNQQIPPLTQTMPTVPPRQTSIDYGPPRPAPPSMPSTAYQTSSASVSYPDFSRQAAYAKTSNHQMQHYASTSSKHKEYRSAMPNMTMPSSSSSSSSVPSNNSIQFPMQDQQMHHHSGYAQVSMPSHGAHADQSDNTFFSVNQLVNHKGQFQMGNPHPFSTKKSNKRTSTSSSSSTPQSTATARYQKQARQVEVKTDQKKEETRKAAKNSSRQASSGSSGRGTNSGNSRSSSSSQASKRSYTAESLLSTHAVGAGQTNEYQATQANPMHHHSRTASNYPRVSSEKASSSSNRMPELNWNVGSSSSADTSTSAAATQHLAPFPSISPSPNLFSQDFGGFDFPMFGTTDHMSAHHQKPRKDQTSARYADVNQQISSNTNQAPPQQVHQQDFHHVQDSSGQQLFDANFFSTTGTLTPSPSVTGVYPGHDESYINFSSNVNPVTSTASTVSSGRQYKSRQNQVQHQQNNQMDHQLNAQHHPQHLQGGYSSQQQQLLSGTGSSSYSNFNLSTIFPDLHGLPPTDKIAALLPTVPPPPPAPLPSSSSSRSTSTSLALSTGTSIPSTPEILAPHSISIFGAAGHHAPHQMSFGSMPPFSAASFHHHSSSTTSSTQPVPAPAPPPPSGNSSINFGIHEQ